MSGVIMRKLVLALLGLAFAVVISACNDQGRKCRDPEKCPEKQERHHRRW